MQVNIELAKKLLKEKYFINGDNGIRTQHPIRVEDLAFIMQKYADQQLDIDSKLFTAKQIADMLVKDFATIEEAIHYFDTIK